MSEENLDPPLVEESPDKINAAAPPLELEDEVLARIKEMSPEERLLGLRDFQQRHLKGERFNHEDTMFALALIHANRPDPEKAKAKKAKAAAPKRSLAELLKPQG
jgi:hypothetical protein